MENIHSLQYPIGKFQKPEQITPGIIAQWIYDLETLPQRLAETTQNLTPEQLDTPYRPGGWTVRQLVHHIADSHHHSYTRFKWALTETEPTIKAYDEKSWCALFDAKTAPITLSLGYITALHAKLVYLLKGLSAGDLQKCYIHPDGNARVTVEENIGKYAWHSNHHLAHIKALLAREGWQKP